LILSGTGNILGHGVVVHQLADNCAQPTGGAGLRYAYCVVGIANATAVTPLSIPVETPSTQNTSLCLQPTTQTTSPTSTDNGSGAVALTVYLAYIVALLAFASLF
jgi:hypothetical protein